MARIRTIKPDFWTDEKLTECSVSARLLFIGMFNFADDNGNLAASAKKLKMQIFPADNIDCQPLLNELIAQGILIEYSVSGDNYLNIKGFKKHQVINRPSKSSIPQPPIIDDSVSPQTLLIDGREEEGKGKDIKDKAAAVNTSTAVAPVDNSPPSPPEPEGDNQKSPSDDNCTPARCAVLLTRWERERGKAIEITSTDPRLVDLADKRFTALHLRAAYDLAVADREANEDPSPINTGFVGVFLSKVMRQPRKRDREPSAVVLPWPCSAPSIVAKGLELGVIQGDQELFPYFKARVFAAAGLTESERSQILADYGVRV